MIKKQSGFPYDDEPVAAQLWIDSYNRAVIYKEAYNEKFANLSHSTILTSHLMRHALDVDQVQEIDYLIVDDVYNRDWMNRQER